MLCSMCTCRVEAAGELAHEERAQQVKLPEAKGCDDAQAYRRAGSLHGPSQSMLLTMCTTIAGASDFILLRELA